jgi:4a-hydroxytetrahydrobiopterin dehydratase
MREELLKKKCVPCETGTDPFDAEKIKIYWPSLSTDWKLIDAKKIRLEYKGKSFMDIVKIIDKIAEIAENEGHHPDLFLSNYRHLAIELMTHNIGGLSENDFIVAVKIEEFLKNWK